MQLIVRIVVFGFVLLAAAELASAQPCSGPLPGGLPLGLVAKTADDYNGVPREYCVYVPSSYVAGTPMPVVFALHGGSGNAGTMYGPAKGIPTYAESEGFLAVFPNGEPGPACGAGCTDFYWDNPLNVGYMDTLLTALTTDYTIDVNRVFFVGFSGGAKLIYRLASDPTWQTKIRAVATVAGTIGRKSLNPLSAPWEIIDLTAQSGSGISALLVQGELDPKQPAAGGLNTLTRDELLLSFRTKVDWWRAYTSTSSISPVVPAGPLPAGVSAKLYTDPAGLEVMEVLDQNLDHAWPSWDLMRMIMQFFGRQ